MTIRQTPPFAVQIEFSCGCNLRCPFCGINAIRGKERVYEFMTVETAKTIARRLHNERWPSFRTEFALHGEPTQNPNAVELISIFRKYLPDNYFLMETNGSGFLGKSPEEVTAKVLSYFNAGLDTIGLDEYQNVPWGNTVRTKINRDALKENGISYHEYPSDPEGNPHSRTKKKRFTIIASIDTSTHGTHATLNNHAGSGAPLDTSMVNQRCAKPFRELSILWDGNVALCCFAGDTLVQSPEGDISISELATKFKLGLDRYPVYSVDITSGEMKIKSCTAAWKVGIKRVRELVFDDGTKIRLTHDHKLYLRPRHGRALRTPIDFKEIYTGNLKVGDRIWAPKLFLGNGYWKIRKNVLFRGTYDNTETVHRAYAEFLNGGPIPNNFDVHHENETRSDNVHTNLQVISKSLHTSHHAKERMNRLTLNEKIAYAKRASDAALRKLQMKRAQIASSNHKIVAINELPAEPVYDFTVEDFHTALVGSGVLAHNCNDWTGAYQIGNVVDTSVDKVWNHPRFYAARQKLLHKQRDFGSCFGCNNRSYRVGLLPDKFGKETLPIPDAKTEKTIQEALADGPIIQPVDRGWNTDRALVQIAPVRSLF